MPSTLNLPVWFEVGSLVILTLILVVDLLLVLKRPHIPSAKESTLWVVFYVGLALVFALLMLIFAASQLLLPPGEIKAGDSLPAHFADDGRFALLLFAAYLAAGAVANVTLFGGALNALWLYLDIPLIVLPVAVFFADRRWQRMITLAYVPLFVADLVISLQT